MDWGDIFVVCGVLCLAGAVWLALGWVGVLGYAGAVCMIVGLLLARRSS